MSLFDNNITKEHPYAVVFHYVSEFIDLHFHHIMKDTKWKTQPAEKTIEAEFQRKHAVFDYYHLPIPRVYISTDGINDWRVIVECGVRFSKDPVVTLFDQIIPKQWSDIKDILTNEIFSNTKNK